MSTKKVIFLPLLLALLGSLVWLGPAPVVAEEGDDPEADLYLSNEDLYAMDLELEAAHAAILVDEGAAMLAEAGSATLADDGFALLAEDGAVILADFEANLVRTIDISAGGTYARLLLGDVSGNGRMEIVTMQADYMSSDSSTGHYVQCLAAFDIATGAMLWRIGTPTTQFGSQGTDIPAQIYDIDGDGYNEVLAVMNNPSQLRIFDGRTGTLKATRPLPTASARDALMIANLRGLGFPQDIVLKDRYNNQWAYSYDPWQLLWYKSDGGSHGLGHYPWPYDWNGDGKDEIMAGFRLLAPDGTQLWRAQGLADHADSMWIGDMNEDGEVEIVIGGGTNSVVLYSKEGYEIWRTDGIRESQNVFMGYFRDDLPGMQVAGLDRVNRSTGPAGQDALFLVGYDGTLLWHEDRPARGEFGCWSTIPEPIHDYTGSGLDEILTWFRGCGVLPGIYDGYGERAATIPIDGRMMRGNLCGDEREEVVVFVGGDKAYIYSLDTCDDLDGPAPGTPLPQTQPRVQYNFSRYTAGSTPLKVEPQPRVATPVEPGTNLALGKPKTASGSSTTAGLSAVAANDGSTTTRWQAGATTYPQWWAVDLGAVYELTGSQVRWYASNRAFRYRVEVSVDDNDWNPIWTTVADRTGNTTVAQTQSDSFGAAGRYVRIYITGVTGGSGAAAISEFGVFGNAPTPPVITPAVSGTLGDNGWYVSDVDVSWDVTDPETAITATDGCDATTINYDTDGVTLTCTATSSGGTSSASVTIKRDATSPTVSVTGVANGATYILGSVPAAGCDTQDALSGVATPASASVTGGNANGVGAFTATCSGAVDDAGNVAAPVSVTYYVIYDWSGFFRPVSNLPTLNEARAGSAIPVKFSLNGDQGLNIFAEGYPLSVMIACDSTAPVDDIEETVTAGGSSLSYDASEDQYVYVWKTDRAWAGTCRQLVVRLNDNVEYRANFRFK